MSVIRNELLLAGDDAYNIQRSLRFRSSASAYLNRTLTSNTNRRISTFSAWVKWSLTGSSGFPVILDAAANGSSFRDSIYFNGSNLTVLFNGGVNYTLTTSQVFRDPSAWYHIVVAIDTTQATASNRVKIYVNGSQVTSFSTANYPVQNYDPNINSAIAHNIARSTSANDYFDGYLAEINFIDGQTLTPSSFGQNNPQTGVWQPKKYTGTYGTNGFYLPFTNNSTTTTLGNDFSGNGNNWTTNNISLTSGATYDSMTDVPTLTSATQANYCTLNPILQNGWWAAPSRGNIINGNLTLSQNNGSAFSTFDLTTSGKWYFEVTIGTYGQSSSSSSVTISARSRSTFEVGYLANGQRQVNGSASAYGSSWTTGDIIGVAVDPANNQITFYKNGVSQGAITNTFPAETVLGGYYAEATGTDTVHFNFGQRPFAYTPPTGFVALNTFNLPTPTIGATASTRANRYFDATTYTGNGSTQSIVNAGGFQPDLVWAKRRSGLAQSNNLADSVRGVQKMLYSDLTIAESTDVNAITAFNSNGFSTGSSGGTNNNADSYVAWQWNAGGSTVTNTSGSISSQVRANTSAGFSIVTYTGTGANATVGHGLGVAPRMIIVKNRASATDWAVYHASIGNTGALRLNLTAITETDSRYWNNTTPTSSVFSVGSSGTVNGSSNTQVAYCFSEVAGYSRFGSYTGNLSTDGTFVFTGFRPAFIMIKRTDSTGFWTMLDNKRLGYNVTDKPLYANATNAESTAQATDFLSNGFKLRTTDSDVNASGTYIFMAFAEVPTKFSLAR